MKEDKEKIDLVYPKKQAEIKNAIGEMKIDRFDQVNEAHGRRDLVMRHMKWQQDMTDGFYGDLTTKEDNPIIEGPSPGQGNFEGISGIEERKSNFDKHPRDGSRISQMRDEHEEFQNDESSMNVDYEGKDLQPSSKIDLWKKLQDLMRNQFREEQQVVREKDKKLTSQHKKYFKIELPKTELDKFKPGKKMDDFKVNLVFSTKYFDRPR